MKCFFHDDIDGAASMSLIAQYENNYDEEDYFEVDYVKELPYDKIKPGERVYFVDYSFSTSTIDRLRKILEISDDVIWIDHHQSSIEALEENPDLYDHENLTIFVINKKISGAGLTWMYINNEKDLSNAPLYIKLVSDYDCWILHNKDAMLFKHGMMSIEYNKPTSIVWSNLKYNDYINSIIEKGKAIEGYIKADCKSYLDKFSFEAKLPGYNYKILACNRKENSILFGDEIYKYDIVCPFVFNGDVFIYSLFSSKEYINCKEIAESFGGGGHISASGFSSKNMVLEKI